MRTKSCLNHTWHSGGARIFILTCILDVPFLLKYSTVKLRISIKLIKIYNAYVTIIQVIFIDEIGSTSSSDILITIVEDWFLIDQDRDSIFYIYSNFGSFHLIDTLFEVVLFFNWPLIHDYSINICILY